MQHENKEKNTWAHQIPATLVIKTGTSMFRHAIHLYIPPNLYNWKSADCTAIVGLGETLQITAAGHSRTLE